MWHEDTCCVVPATVSSSGSLAVTPQKSRNPAPAVNPPCSVTPLRGRASTVRSTPCQW